MTSRSSIWYRNDLFYFPYILTETPIFTSKVKTNEQMMQVYFLTNYSVDLNLRIAIFILFPLIQISHVIKYITLCQH